MTTPKVFRITYQENWGTRLPRKFHNFYITRKPSRQEIIDVLNKHKIPCTQDWFRPCNSGLVSVRSLEFEF